MRMKSYNYNLLCTCSYSGTSHASPGPLKSDMSIFRTLIVVPNAAFQTPEVRTPP